MRSLPHEHATAWFCQNESSVVQEPELKLCVLCQRLHKVLTKMGASGNLCLQLTGAQRDFRKASLAVRGDPV